MDAFEVEVSDVATMDSCCVPMVIPLLDVANTTAFEVTLTYDEGIPEVRVVLSVYNPESGLEIVNEKGSYKNVVTELAVKGNTTLITYCRELNL
jgi:hypothetical protein